MNEFLVLLARELLCDIPWTKKKLVSMLEILFFQVLFDFRRKVREKKKKVKDRKKASSDLNIRKSRFKSLY